MGTVCQVCGVVHKRPTPYCSECGAKLSWIIPSREELDRVKRDLSIVSSYPQLEFGDFDIRKTRELLLESPFFASRLVGAMKPPLPPPPRNKKGNYLLTNEGGKQAIPAQYSGHVELACFVNAQAGSEMATGVFVWKWLMQALEWLLCAKQTLQKQVCGIVKSANEHYQHLRMRLRELRKKHGNDNLLEVVFLLPDLFVYLIRLLSHEDVPKAYKAKLAVALVYLVSPIDLIPELLINHPIAFADDLVVLLGAIKAGFDEKIISRELSGQLWPGEMSLVDSLGEWYEAVEKVLGGDFIKSLATYLKGKVQGSPAMG